MTNTAKNFFTTGRNATAQLVPGTNLSYKGTGTVLNAIIELDRWHLGDFTSAIYTISVEHGLNERETIQAILVAMPGNATVTVYGRTTLTRPLVNVTAAANNSYASLIVSPATESVSGSIVTFFASYASASSALQPMNASGIAADTHWLAATDVTSLSVTVNVSKLTGFIQVGQSVTGLGIPFGTRVTAWNSTTGALTLGNFIETTFSAASIRALTFNTSPDQLSNITSVIDPVVSFNSIAVHGQDTIVSKNNNDQLEFVPGLGINILTDAVNKAITFNSKGISAINVPGQLSIVPSNNNEDTLNVLPGTGIEIETDPISDTLTVTSTGVIFSTNDLNKQYAKTTIAVTGVAGITTSFDPSGNILINNTKNTYTSFKYSSTQVSANALSSVFEIATSAGVSATLEAATSNTNDKLTISNTGVLSIGGITGALTGTNVITAINTSTSSINVPIGSISPNTGAFTSLSAAGVANLNSDVNIVGNAILSGELVVSGFTQFISPAIMSSFATVGGNLSVGGATYTAGLVNKTNYMWFPATGTINFDVLSGNILFYGIAATSSFVINIRSSATQTFDALVAVGQYTDLTVIYVTGGSAYTLTSITVDGVAATIKWLNASTPSASTNSTMSYNIRVIKTSVNPSYTVLVSLTRYA